MTAVAQSPRLGLLAGKGCFASPSAMLVSFLFDRQTLPLVRAALMTNSKPLSALLGRLKGVILKW